MSYPNFSGSFFLHKSTYKCAGIAYLCIFKGFLCKYYLILVNIVRLNGAII